MVRWLPILLVVAIADLVATVTLHRAGLIQEVNPVMNWLFSLGDVWFVLIKGLTILIGGVVGMNAYKDHAKFVNRVALVVLIVYVAILLVNLCR